MSRRVVISGLGPVSALGLGIEPTWQALLAGRSGLGRIDAFDPSGFESQIGGQVRDLKISNFVPKSYRKATKVMARDIEMAVAAADMAARDAGIATKGTAGDAAGFEPSYPVGRVGCQIGAGLIAAELDELTSALIQAKNGNGNFDIHKWGSVGMTHLTPLWLLKYLPNMLACHVTIIHDTQGPSNTITCGEASGILSIGESLRVIQRNSADMCFCGGADSKINPMAFLRQQMTGLLNSQDNAQAAAAVRPFCTSAAGTAAGEGGAIVIIETLEGYTRRGGKQAYAEVVGFGAAQTVNRESRNLRPDRQGRSIALAISAALRDAGAKPEEVDLIVPVGLGAPDYDQAEAAALASVFGSNLGRIRLAPMKPYIGNCAAGSAALDVCLAAKALATQTAPVRLNTRTALPGLDATAAPSQPMDLRFALIVSASTGGQNAALLLKRFAP